jgi:phage terminase large subunit
LTATELAARLTGISLLDPTTGENRWFYQPTAQQLKFHTSPKPYRLIGGAAGGGKSHAERMEAYMRCLLIPGYRVLLLRRTLPELKKTHLLELARELTELLGLGLKGGPSFKDVYRASDYLVTFPNGSMLQFGSCDTDDAASKYLSTEWDTVFFDELTTFPLQMYRMIESRVGRRAGMPWSVAAGTNPVGIGANWVKTLWITKDPTAEEAPKYNPDAYAYIPATIEDNPYLSADYADKLESLPSEALRQAYRYGSWEFLEGQFFNEFRSEKQGQPWHVLTEMPTVAGVPVTDLPWLEWFRSIDWGIGNLTVVGWYCCLPNGRILKVFERTWKEFISGPALGREIVAFTRKKIKGRVRYTVTDPKMHSREGSLGTPVAEDLAKAGVSCIPADNERELGWAQLKTWLGTVGPDGLPLFQVYRPGCPHTVKTLPSLVGKKGNPDDLEKGQDDHCADETRYALMSRPSATKVKARADQTIGDATPTHGAEFRRFTRQRHTRGLDLKARFSLAWR